jgi:hypothetical protein
MTSQNFLNESMVSNSAAIAAGRPRGQSGASGYADTGYGESMNHGSRDGTTGNVEASGDPSWSNNPWSNGAAHPSGANGIAYPSPNPWGQYNGATQASGPLQYPTPRPQAEVPQHRNVIKLSQAPSPALSPAASPAASPAPSPVESEAKRKSWLGRRFSKK